MTSSVDYVVLLRGEVTLLLDEDEVSLKPFDGNDNDGRSRIIGDGPAFEFGTLSELWATDTSPSGYGSDDEVAKRRVKLEPRRDPAWHESRLDQQRHGNGRTSRCSSQCGSALD